MPDFSIFNSKDLNEGRVLLLTVRDNDLDVYPIRVGSLTSPDYALSEEYVAAIIVNSMA